MIRRDASEFTPCCEETIKIAKQLSREIKEGKIDVSTFKKFDPVEYIDSVENAVLNLLVLVEDEDELGDITRRIKTRWDYIREASLRYGYSVTDVEEMFEIANGAVTAEEFSGAMAGGYLRELLDQRAAACAL
ncbi:MAG: hypothetical protein FWB85_07320 [Chitinispirillia bacterium]|nr:hypothetical protein [Chitinispirillia bacterium]MCL2242049.1 hypothetical protein [Chitinispirillia bacterium]